MRLIPSAWVIGAKYRDFVPLLIPRQTKTIKKQVHDIIEISQEATGRGTKKRMSVKDAEARIKELEKQMKEAAKMLDFEYAALLRDQIIQLRGDMEKKR